MRALILAPFSDRYLRRLGQRIDVTFESWLETNRLYDPEELGARLARDRIDVLIVEADFVFDEVFAAGAPLRLVGVCRNALNQVDLESATAHGVAVVHAPGRNTNAVAEMTIALMLSLARRIPHAASLVAGAGWSDPALGYRAFQGREIQGSVIGVAGFGHIGREVTRKCLALGARVLVHDPYVADRQIRALGATPVALRHLARKSDFITLHLPAVDATHHLIDGAFMGQMRPTAFLINTGSGSSVAPRALAAALEAHTIAGAALDIFEGQPLPPSSPLCNAPNIILTPHIGGATRETIERQSRMMTSEIERLLDGRPFRHLVNADYQAVRAS